MSAFLLVTSCEKSRISCDLVVSVTAGCVPRINDTGGGFSGGFRRRVTPLSKFKK